MEEAFEVTMASMGNEGKKRKIEEISDLFYITIVFMVASRCLHNRKIRLI